MLSHVTDFKVSSINSNSQLYCASSQQPCQSDFGNFDKRKARGGVKNDSDEDENDTSTIRRKDEELGGKDKRNTMGEG